MDKNQQEILSKDTDQLKKDLKDKKKVIQKREVPIRVADPSNTESSSQTTDHNESSSSPGLGTSLQDEIARRNLGL
jgi:hypothetical protein